MCSKFGRSMVRAIMLAGLAASCLAGSLSAAPVQFKIGVIQSLTGPAEEDGQTILRALRMAAEEINGRGEYSVSLLVEDDATLPRNSVSAYEKLKAQGVSLIVGPSWSFLVRTLAPLAARDGITLFTTSNAPEVLDYKEANGFLFSNSFTIDSVAVPLTRYLDARGVRSAAFIRTDTVWSHAHKASFLPILARHGVQIVSDLVTPAVSDNDFRQWLLRLKDGRVDLLLLFLSRDDSENLLRRGQEIGYRPNFFAAAHTYDSLVRTKNPALYEGLCISYPYLQLHRNQRFRDGYRKRYQDEPRIYADTSYDALFLIAKGVAASRQKNIPLPEGLRAVSHEGVAGRYSYSPSTSFSAGSNDLICVREGKVTALRQN